MTLSLRLASLTALCSAPARDISAFSARHVRLLPLSSAAAVSVSSDIVTFLSSDIWNKFELME